MDLWERLKALEETKSLAFEVYQAILALVELSERNAKAVQILVELGKVSENGVAQRTLRLVK